MNTLNVSCDVGATLEIAFSVVDSDGTAVNLSGFLGRGTIRDKVGGTSIASLDVYITDAVNGRGVATLLPATTAAITATRGFFDVELYLSDGSVVYRPIGGVIFFNSNITT